MTDLVKTEFGGTLENHGMHSNFFCIPIQYWENLDSQDHEPKGNINEPNIRIHYKNKEKRGCFNFDKINYADARLEESPFGRTRLVIAISGKEFEINFKDYNYKPVEFADMLMSYKLLPFSYTLLPYKSLQR